MEKTSNVSQQPEITLNKATSDAQVGDYGMSTNTTVEMLYQCAIKRRAFTDKYGMFGAGFELLVIMGHKWLNEGKGSTVYSLCGGQRNYITHTARIVRDLYGLGLLEVIGYGVRNCRVYIPSSLGFESLNGVSSSSAA